MLRLSALALLFVVSSCCSRPAATAEQPLAEGAAPAAVSEPEGEGGASPSSAPTVPSVETPAVEAPVLQGLAAAVCPPGPYPVPLSGELAAELIPNTAPTTLDPSDTEFHLYEGAVWLNGVLYFSDFKTSTGFPSRIMSFTEERGLSIALADSGTNGLGLDATGTRLVGARHKSKSVVRFDESFAGITDVAAQHQGKPFNSPNDLVFRSDGNLYFTDPDFQAGEQKDQATTNVYRVAPDGQVSVVDDTIKNPNGISLSPDETALFVAGNLEQGYVKRYPLSPDGSVLAGEVVLAPVTVPDGMVFDCAGNLYVTEHTQRRIRVIDAAGQELGQITGLDKNVTNVAFGGDDRKTLYITMTGGLARVRLLVPGLPY